MSEQIRNINKDGEIIKRSQIEIPELRNTIIGRGSREKRISKVDNSQPRLSPHPRFSLVPFTLLYSTSVTFGVMRCVRP